MQSLPFLDAVTMRAVLPWPLVLDALTRALPGPAALDAAPPRVGVPAAHGQLLLMPAESSTALGVKLVGIAPDNPGRGRPRVQAVYVLFDAATLTPLALLDGTALTNIRTPALSALAVQHLTPPDAHRLLVFGSGPQAREHVSVLRTVRPIDSVRVVGRDRARTQAFVVSHADAGLDVSVGGPDDVAKADLVVCATTARTPVFDGELLAADACVVAVGSHEPQARELDDAVFARASTVVVEHRATALREAGDVIAAIAGGALHADSLVELADVVAGRNTGLPGSAVFKSVGMGWQDLAVAEAMWAAVQAG